MTAANEIIAALNEAFADLDTAYIANSKVWAQGRMEALKEAKANQGFKRDYEALYEVAGGKTWYNVFDGRNWPMVEEIVEKNAKAIIAKRNANIAAKLAKAGIQEVTGKRYEMSKDGFHGFYAVNTDQGPKTIEIETIVAGGWNIQAIHQRTLVKVK